MVVISQHNTGQLLTFNVSSSEFSDVIITYDYKHVFDCQPEVSIGSNNDVYRLLPLLRRLHFWFVSLSEKLPAQGNFHINCLKEEPFTFWIRIARRIHTFIFTYVNDLGGGLFSLSVLSGTLLLCYTTNENISCAHLEGH